FPYFSVELVQGDSDEDPDGNREKKFVSKVEKLDLTKFVNTETFSEEDKQLVQQVRKLQISEINKYLNRNSPFSGFWENIIHNENDELPEETKALMIEYLHPKLKKIFDENSSNPFVFYLPRGKTFKTENLREISLVPKPILPEFKVSVRERGFELSCFVKADLQLIPV